SKITYFGRNDLQPVVCTRYPLVGQVATWLESQGMNARMTGSGSCFFIEFVTIGQAELCQQEIIGKMLYRKSSNEALVKNTWACPGLVDHPLRYWVHS